MPPTIGFDPCECVLPNRSAYQGARQRSSIPQKYGCVRRARGAHPSQARGKEGDVAFRTSDVFGGLPRRCGDTPHESGRAYRRTTTRVHRRVRGAQARGMTRTVDDEWAKQRTQARPVNEPSTCHPRPVAQEPTSATTYPRLASACTNEAAARRATLASRDDLRHARRVHTIRLAGGHPTAPVASPPHRVPWYGRTGASAVGRGHARPLHASAVPATRCGPALARQATARASSPASVALGYLRPCCMQAPATSPARPSKLGGKDRASGHVLQSLLLPCAVPQACRQPHCCAACALLRVVKTSRWAHWLQRRMGSSQLQHSYLHFCRTHLCRSPQRCSCAWRPTATSRRLLSPPCSKPTVAERLQPQRRRWQTKSAPRLRPCAIPRLTNAVGREDRAAGGMPAI